MVRRSAPLVAALGLALGLQAHAQEAPAGAGPALEVTEGEVPVAELLQRWAALHERVLQTDPQLEGVRVRFAGAAKLDRATLRHVLDMYDVVLVERDGALEAHHRRNISQRLCPPYDLVQGLAPDNDRFVTAIVPIRHGAGNSIFATVRGLLVRDTNRIGNLLYVQGPEVLILVDLAPNVRYYQQVIAALDRPPVDTLRRTRVTVFEAPAGWWAKEQQAARSPAALVAALRAAAGAESATVKVLGDGMTLGGDPASIERTARLDDGEEVRLSLNHGPYFVNQQVDPTAGLLRLHVEVSGRGAQLRLDTAARVPSTSALVVQGFSGRPGPEPTDIVLVVQRETMN